MIAPETAAHAAGTSALLPMLTLGVPGSPTAAVLLGGLIMWGLQPGPMMFVEQQDFVWGLIASMYLGNVVGLLVVLVAVPWFAAILRVPFSIIASIILVVCAIGAFTVNNSEFDIVVMLVFGVIGYVLKKLEYPLAPLVLALVLGDRTEEAFRQSLLVSEGDMTIFFHNWLSGGIMAAGIVLLAWPVIVAHLAAPRAPRLRLTPRAAQAPMPRRIGAPNGALPAGRAHFLDQRGLVLADQRVAALAHDAVHDHVAHAARRGAVEHVRRQVVRRRHLQPVEVEDDQVGTLA